ncbi:MAG: FG-GAP-like repeat-containing protein [Fuerstiella sp.]
MTDTSLRQPLQKSQLITVALILLSALAAVGPVTLSATKNSLSWKAATALWQKDFAEAKTLAEQALSENPTSEFARIIAADAAGALHQSEAAIELYKLLPPDSEFFYQAQLGLADRYYQKNWMKEAETHLRYVLEHNPTEFEANKQLAFLMQLQGRTWDAVSPCLQMIQFGIFGPVELHILGCPESQFLSDERYLDSARNAAPDDPRSFLATARFAELRNRPDEAAAIFRKVMEADASLLEAPIRLARILLNSNQQEEFLKIMSSLPPSAEDHGGYWLNRAFWATKTGNPQGAARCLFETLQRMPGHVEANYLLSQVLVQLGAPKAAKQFGDRAKILARLEITMPEFYANPTSPELIKTLVDDFESLNRNWEAAAVCQFAMSQRGDPPEWIHESLAALQQKLQRSGNTLLAPAPLSEVAEIGAYEIPPWDTGNIQPNELTTQSDTATNRISFREEAADVGLKFTFFNGSTSVRGMEHIFETTGGGVSTLDFDGDMWPDVYLSQGAPIWEGDDDVRPLDSLFRNTSNGFSDVTEAAGLGDDRFTQGATVGDFNNDGFADLYVGNLTGNRFYRNNGDGTFSEITDETNTAGDEWTVSCMLADLNGDSLQDLYVVNYLVRESVFERRCRQNGHPLTCAPTLFPAEQDRVYQNMGDGSFKEVTAESGVVQAEGKGLAIAAGDFDNSGRLSVFVGNDTAPNFYFQNQTAAEETEIRFTEAGTISGLAVDGMGRSQATMGVACGDVDGSGTIDLFITNFYEDANTLYLQHAPSTFFDGTRDADLYESSIPLLGFGTEFLDADLDGDLDLFVTNGHVDRTNATGEPDEMPPQFFANTGTGKFAEQSGESLGDYFQGKYLGRTVSRLDWNRDGFNDLCISHLYSPVALLTNTSFEAGNSISIRLRGTQCDRDALGTVVTVQAKGRTYTHQLVAGDGYMTTNERKLVVGLGDAEDIDSIEVRWRSGHQQMFNHVAASGEILLVEASDTVWTIPD